MALLFCCGFNSANWDEAALIDLFSVYSTANSNASGGPYGDGYMQLTQGAYIAADVPLATTIRFGHWIYWPETSYVSNDSAQWSLWSGKGMTGNRLCYFKYGDSADTGHYKEWAAVENDGTINWLGDSATMKMEPNAGWSWMEFEIVVSATVGTMKVWKDGYLLGSATGLDTAGSDTSGGLSVSIGGASAHSVRRLHLDDFVIWDNSGSVMAGNNIGAIRIRPTKANGDGSTTQWSPLGAGTNTAEVDENIADEDTSYNDSSTTNDRDELDLETPDGSDFLGVGVHVQAKRVDAGTGTMKIGIKRSTSESTTNVSLSDSPGYKYCSHFTSVDPSTSGAWDATGAAAAQAIYENAG